MMERPETGKISAINGWRSPKFCGGRSLTFGVEYRACRGGNGIREEEPRREQAVLVHDGTFFRADFAQIHFHRFYTGGVIVL